MILDMDDYGRWQCNVCARNGDSVHIGGWGKSVGDQEEKRCDNCGKSVTHTVKDVQ